MKKYDAIILGAGQSGMPLAKKISKLGLKVALIEEAMVGGTCINAGCSPTKTMVASAEVAHMVSRAADFGIRVPEFFVDQKAIKDRKNKIVELFRGGAESSLEQAENIEIIKSRGTFKTSQIITLSTGDHTEEIQGDKIFINTGSETAIPAIEGLELVPYLTSTSIMDLENTPDHLLIIGGGYIGLEFAQMFRRFGSQVTILDRASRLVPKEDKDVCEEISKIFHRTDIQTIFNANIQGVKKAKGKIFLNFQNETGSHQISGSHLLVAVGRIPSSEYLGLEGIGVKRTKENYVLVNEYFESSVKNIFALGDVAGSPPFTHMAYHDAELAFNHIYKGKTVSSKDRLAPYCIFMDPQLARVGLNEQEAIEKKIPYRIGKFWMKHAGRTLETDNTDGFFKVLVDPETKKILGATILSMDGGEILTVLQMAMLGGISYEVIKTLPISHPTLAESLNNLMGSIEE